MCAWSKTFWRQRSGAVTVFFVAVALAGCGSPKSPDSAKPVGSLSELQAPNLTPQPEAAPPLRLKNQDGQTIDLANYRGKAVYVMFIFTRCPDVCPLMTGNLRNALARLGPKADQAQVIAVSVDPRGDTVARVKNFIAAHDMTGRMEYLIGSKAELEPVWKAWGVQVETAPGQVEVGHSSAIYGITGSGRLAAIYPANFKPAWVVHDTPILASH